MKKGQGARVVFHAYENAKYFIWATAVVVVIGGLTLYWSMTHEIEYAIKTKPDEKAYIKETDEEETRENKNEDPLKVVQAGAVDLAVEFASAIEETQITWNVQGLENLFHEKETN